MYMIVYVIIYICYIDIYIYIIYIYIYVIIDVYILLYNDLICVGKTSPFLLIDSPQILFGQYLHVVLAQRQIINKKQVAEKNNSE